MNTRVEKEKVKVKERLFKIEEIERLLNLRTLLTNEYCSFKGVVFTSKKGPDFNETDITFKNSLPNGFIATLKNIALASLDSEIRKREKELVGGDL